jgi:cytochrome c553
MRIVVSVFLFVSAHAQVAAPSQKGSALPVNHPQTIAQEREFVGTYCAKCHNDKFKSGGMSLAALDLAKPAHNAELAEKVIAKLRAGMMPPAKALKHPDAAQLNAFVGTLESRVDQVALSHPYVGYTGLHRLNRVEYENSVRALLGLDVDVTSLLPADDLSHGFNNIADALTESPALLGSYINAANKISRQAVGDLTAPAAVTTYRLPRVISQTRHVDGTPFGTRGGIAVTHNFPADGEYVFKVSFYTHQQGYLFGQNQGKGQQVEIAVNGARVALLDVDPKWKVGQDLKTSLVKVQAGPQEVSAAFIKKFDGPVQDEVQPYEQSLLDVNVANLPGLTTLPHLRDLNIVGPYRVTGVSQTPSRNKIFACRPASTTEEAGCARKIVSNLVRQAYRKPAAPVDVTAALKFYQDRRAKGESFDEGIRASLQAILANPQFIFRFERVPLQVKAGGPFLITDLELASRLSYFLWSAPPDSELLRVANQGSLRQHAVLSQQVHRMLKDPRAQSLSSNFAVQWLNLKNLNEVLPDPYLYPNFDNNLAQSMLRETELFFGSIVQNDSNVLDLLNADYTFVDERLAQHYGIPDVMENRFRRVHIKDENRRGLLGQGSILTLTSTANRTSPVVRGKWVLQVLFGAPPPPPPPGVPPLGEAGEDNGVHTVRQRLEEHRKNPACASCHSRMDPIGFALENFDPTGAWRSSDSGAAVDASGQLFDGSQLTGPRSLREAVVKHSDSFLRAFTENLLVYGVGRVPDYRDRPAIRAIVAKASQQNYRFSRFVLGIVESPAFQQRQLPAPQLATPDKRKQLQASNETSGIRGN